MPEADVLESETMPSEELGVTDSPEAPEGLVEAEATEEVAEGSQELDADGQPRDERGRFAPKSQAEPQADGIPAPAAPTEAVLSPVEPTLADGQDFIVKSDGREFPVPGAKFFPGEGLYVPEDQLPEVQKLISEGYWHRQNWRKQETQWKAQIAEAQAKATPQDLVDRENRANALLAELTSVLTNEDALVEFVQNLQVNGPALQERARARELQEKLAKYEQQERQVTGEAQTQQEQSDKAQAFEETVEAMKVDARFRAFAPEDWQEFVSEMAELEQVLFVRKEDGLYLDQGRMVKAAETRARLLSKANVIAQKQVAGVKEAVKFNAQRTAPKPQPPAAAAPPEPQAPIKETRDEWKKRNGIYV